MTQRVCIDKLTNKLIESQSGGDTPELLETLILNALAAGYQKDNIEVKYVTDEEFAIILKRTLDTEAAIAEQEYKNVQKNINNLEKKHITIIKILMGYINKLHEKTGLPEITFDEVKIKFEELMS